MVHIGAKIRQLRRERGISQEVLAENLGVTFQAVSKWENGAAMPDVMLIPAIAMFFGVTTDELFDFRLYEQEQEVERICRASWACRGEEPARAEGILRDGLRRFPGNELLLNNLLYTIDHRERAAEIAAICKALLAAAKLEDVRLDALQHLAQAYHYMGEQGMVRETLEKLPEIYFTKLECAAELLDGEEARDAAARQKRISLRSAVDMCRRLAELAGAAGDAEGEAAQLQTTRELLILMQADSDTQRMPGLAEQLDEVTGCLAQRAGE